MNPVGFERLVERIRARFERDHELQATLASLRMPGVPDHAMTAAAAVLVNEGFLEWWDGRLVRTDAPKTQIVRRTA